MGIGYFWFFGGTVMLMTIQMAKEISGGGDDFSSVGAVLMAWMSGGTVLGGILASVICRRHIRMNVSVAGGVLMAASCAALAAVSMTSPVFNALLMAAGISAALFLVPLNAFFQDRADNDKRGDMIAAGNLVDCALGLLAVGFQYAMMLVIPPSWQFVVMGILSLFMAWAVFRFPARLPAQGSPGPATGRPSLKIPLQRKTFPHWRAPRHSPVRARDLLATLLLFGQHRGENKKP